MTDTDDVGKILEAARAAVAEGESSSNGRVRLTVSISRWTTMAR